MGLSYTNLLGHDGFPTRSVMPWMNVETHKICKYIHTTKYPVYEQGDSKCKKSLLIKDCGTVY